MVELIDTVAGVSPATEHLWSELQIYITHSTWGLPVGRILIALGIFLFFLILRRPQRYLLMVVMGRLANRPIRDLDPAVRHALKGPAGIVPVAIGAFFAFEVMKFDQNGDYAEIASRIVATMVLTALFWALFELTSPFVASLKLRSSALSPTMADMIRHTVKGVLVFAAVALILQEWGVEIGPLLAGMGLIGAAVALGAQDLFKNLVAGFLILAEKRFKYGDWIEVNGVVEGTVEYIGVRSTRIRRFDDAAVDVPNNAFSENALINYTKMRRRRILWTIGVPYSTTVDQLKTVRDGIEHYILTSPDFVRPNQASTHVRIDAFGGSSINILVYCFTVTTSWREWLEVQEQLAYAVMNVVLGAGTSFAFPSRSVYVESIPNDRPDLFLPPVDGKPRIEPATPTEAPQPAPSGASEA
ncbi:mechanosensitive ion channel family protein [Acuticoccus sp. M5D2P5]|uniref:mechanosensitive ion channel family protein n=1 Tax=Acuticoccus kalidii TaxID=2910977 RepID=UPI001F4296DE|nr:mechanosensitive ion channel family protein [Acuticoccus kalidii]MCF3932049.1 mechanosensitive ion channel family protein [Acuticoccus kalidii]